MFASIRQPIIRTTTETWIIASWRFRWVSGLSKTLQSCSANRSRSRPARWAGARESRRSGSGQELIFRNQNRAISLRSTFSVGVDLFGATLHDDTIGDRGVDSQYLTWLGQFQYVWRLPRTENLLIFRVAGQLASDSLPSLEQFSVGGIDTVRGYRENQLVRDQAIVGTIEYRHSLLHRAGRSILEVAPFVDLGYGRDVHELPIDETQFLSSVGVGLLFHPNDQFIATIYYGYAFEDFDQTSDLQDIGIHFSIVYQPL